MKTQGTAHKYGDNVDTDVIIPARYLNTASHKELAAHCMEDIDAQFVNKVQEGDIMVAEKNFGCGSSREHAPQSLKRWGVRCIIAESFSEIFQGNCVALGIPCFVADHATAEKILDFVEKNPEKPLFVSVVDRLVKLGDYQPVLRLQIKDGSRGQFLDGSWNAQSQLLDGAERAAKLASELPYMRWKLH